MVLNVFFFLNNFPIRHILSSIYIQTPNSIITVTWKPLKCVHISLPAKDTLLCTVLSGVGLWWPINEAEQSLAQSKLLCFPGDPCAVNSASALIKVDKNTCHLPTSEAHCKDGSCSQNSEFFRRKVLYENKALLSGMLGENEARPISRT